MNDTPDLLIIGGGLAGGLSALALAKRRPELDIRLIERDATIGGNHVWSFFDSDVAPEDRWLTDPLVVQRWACNAIRFPKLRRLFEQPYNSIRSDRFHEHVSDVMGDRIIRADVAETRPDGVTFADGTTMEARAVLDARGLSKAPEGFECGWQKFVGQMLEVEGGHGLTVPVIMDATVDQSDGYRFVYLLPFDEERVFVEDTYYHLNADLDKRVVSQRIGDYAASQGWENHRVLHQEEGVLPVVIDGDFDKFWPADDPVARAGVSGGFFHLLTSYSIPEAVRFAAWLAENMPMQGDTLARATRRLGKAHWRSSGFNRLLVKFLFHGEKPPKRYVFLQHFYGLPDRLIERFYAGRSAWYDKMRIMSGKPPIPLSRAIRTLLEKRPS